MKRLFLLILAAAGLLASCAKDPAMSDSGQSEPDRGTDKYGDDVLKGWVRLRLTDNATALRVGSFTRGVVESGDPRIDEVAASFGATEIRPVFGSDPRFEKRHRRYGMHLWYDIRIDEDVPVSRAETAFASLPGVAQAKPISRVYLSGSPDYPLPSEIKPAAYEGNKRDMPFDDPELPLQWHYDNDGSVPNSLPGADVNLFKAWEMFGAGDPSVVVAVMDMGIKYDHPDLEANMWVNQGEVNGRPNTDNDGNGIKNDLYGYNALSGRGDIAPGDHGTHVAGTVAAVNNNGIGVCGVAGGTGEGDGARLMSCQIFSPEGGEDRDYPDVYRYAADNGAVISQNSWNYSPMYSALPEEISLAFDYFINEAGVDDDGNQTGPMKGGIIIFSAGNDYQARITWPAADPRTVTVTSMMANYAKASYSNFGDAADIMAPGGAGNNDTEFGPEGKVYSTVLDGYGYNAGTSMAAPHVSGIAALIISHYGVGKPGFTPEKLKEILLKGYRSVDRYQKSDAITHGIGVGLVDASMIDLADPVSAPANPSSVSAEPSGERKLEVHIVVPADGNGMPVSDFHISYAKEGAEDWTELHVYNRRSVGETAKYMVGNLDHETTYIFRVSTTDRFGNVSEGYAEGRGTTIEHANLTPETVKPLTRVEFPQFGADPYRATVELTEYFTDPDLPNDKLTFSAVSDDDKVVSVEVNETGTMILTAHATGNTVIRIRVEDLAGAFITKNMGVLVKMKESAAIELPDNTLPEPFVKTVDLYDYFFGEDLSFTAHVVFPSIASAQVLQDGKLEITGLKKGVTPVTVTATTATGGNRSQQIKIVVNEDPQNGGGGGEEIPAVPAGELRLYPNPASDVINIRVGGAGAGSGTVRIYDAAARMVKNGSVSLDADGIAADNDVSALSPGIYSLVVECGGRTYTGNFLKR